MKDLIEKAMPAKPHILDARVWAEQLNSMPPEKAMEKFEEVKAHWVRLKEKGIEQIKEL